MGDAGHNAALAAAASIMGWVVYDAIRKQRVLTKGSPLRRREHHIAYWLVLAGYFLFGVLVPISLLLVENIRPDG